MCRAALVSIFLVVFSIPSLLFAESLSLEQALLHGIDQSTLAASLKHKIALKLSDAEDIQTIQNPRIQVDAVLIETRSSQGFDVEVIQPLRLSDFHARPDLARAMNELSGIEEKLMLLNLIHALTEQYVHVWIVQEHQRIVEENLNFAKRTNTLLKKAEREGQAQPAETYLFDAETEQLDEELRELSLELSQAKVRFLQQLGLDTKTVTLKSPRVLQLGRFSEFLEGDTASARELLLRQQVVLEQRLRVAELDSFLPEISPRFLYDRRSRSKSHSTGIGISLTFPLWDTQRGKRMRIKSEQQFVDTSLRNLERTGFQDLAEKYFERAGASARRAKNYSTGIVPKYKKALDATEAMRASGQATVMQLWLIHERLHDAELSALEAVRTAFAARAELELLAGKQLGELYD